MRVTVGHHVGGAPVTLALVPSSVTAVLGDPGTGKTMLVRHLVRWWLADLDHTVDLVVDRPHEYADLLPRAPRGAGTPNAATPGASRLVVLDSGDAWSAEAITRLATHASVLLTTTGAAARDLDQLEQADPRCEPMAPACDITFLAPLEAGSTTARSNRPSSRWRNDPHQGRLDWPSSAIQLRADALGPYDLPPHRWWMGDRAG